MQLFSAAGDSISLILPTSFADNHKEARLQTWADRNPALVNEGQPMLSLGREIVTKYSHAIDNLFIDGDGVLVVAEMKRGKATREVLAQTFDYAAFADSLNWQDVDLLCQKCHSSDLASAFSKTFGRSLDTSSKPTHRLAIVAEIFGPEIIDTAVYHINRGIRLALIEFRLFKAGVEAVLQMNTVLGEIPKQGAAKTLAEAKDHASEGYAAWLLSSVGEKLPEIAAELGWPLRHRINRQSIPFGSADWPLPLGECQLRVDVFKSASVSLRFSFRKASAPDLREFLEARELEWKSAFPAKFDPADPAASYLTMTLDLARPEIGNKQELNNVLGALKRMTNGLGPLVDRYFTEKEKTIAIAGEKTTVKSL